MSQGRRPAAQVTRIGQGRSKPAAAAAVKPTHAPEASAPAAANPPPPPPPPAAEQQEESDDDNDYEYDDPYDFGGGHEHGDDDEARPRPAGVLAPAIPGILGEVVERPSSNVVLPPAPRNPGAPPVPFPVAEHRRVSKFSLGRRAAAGGPAAVAAAAAAAAPAEQQEDEAPAEAVADIIAKRPPGSAAAATTALPSDEMAQISLENQRQVQTMAAREREAALADLKSRFGADKLEFLRKRAAAKQQAGGAAVVSTSAGAQQQQQQQQRQQLAAKQPAKPALRRGFFGKAGGGSKPSCAVEELQQELAQQQSKQPRIAPAKPLPKPAAAPAARRPLVARLRFNLQAVPIAADPPDQPAAEEAAVLTRDQISRDSGVAPEGYNLDELQVLARSSHPPQRAAALHALGALLAAARPRVQDLGADGMVVPRPVALPSDVLQG